MEEVTERRHYAVGKHLLAHTAHSIHLRGDSDRQFLLLMLHMGPVACPEALLQQLQPQTLQQPPAWDQSTTHMTSQSYSHSNGQSETAQPS